MATSYGVFGVFLSTDGTLRVQPSIAFGSVAEATTAAEFLAGALGGAVTFSREVDLRTGAMKDGVIIAKFGIMADQQAAPSEAA